MPYRLYVDEVGNDDLTHVADEAHRYLSLTGVAIRDDHNRDVLVPAMHRLKADIFRHDADHPVVLHRTDIMGKKGPFGILADDDVRRAFDDRVFELLRDSSYTVITVVIDKKAMVGMKHWRKNHPYHYLMEILVEKYARWLVRKNDIGDIMPEERKGKKDKELERAYEHVRIWGTDFANPRLIEERIPSDVLRFRNKRDNIAGLQVCDLIAHPSYIDVRRRQRHAVNPGAYALRVIPLLLNTKYDRGPWGGINGFGTKYLP